LRQWVFAVLLRLRAVLRTRTCLVHERRGWCLKEVGGVGVRLLNSLVLREVGNTLAATAVTQATFETITCCAVLASRFLVSLDSVNVRENELQVTIVKFQSIHFE
jgi:hypothetical protein